MFSHYRLACDQANVRSCLLLLYFRNTAVVVVVVVAVVVVGEALT